MTCGSSLRQEFEYVTQKGLGNYFAIWGCHQINESKYDRGLWVLGSNKNPENIEMLDSNDMVTTAMNDLKLENVAGIKRNIVIINLNKFTPEENLNCAIDRSYNQCFKIDWPYLVKKHKTVTLILLFLYVVVFVIVSIYIAYTFN